MLRVVFAFLLLSVSLMTIAPGNLGMAWADPAVCYWQSATGETIDLSSLCGQAANPNQAANSLQSLLKTYPPNIQQDVTQYFQQNRDSVMAQAQTTCRILRYGGEQAANTRRQALVSYHGGNEAVQARQATIDAYAIGNYCPEFAKVNR
jgi:hypothetical protein